MCGLNGIYAYKAAANSPLREELIATRDQMAKRGPDGAGEWWSGDRRCGLGHRRLSIIDLSDRALQPMASADGKLVIAYNGEIYNSPALRADLQAKGARFRTTSDTEVLLHLYRRDGPHMVRHLRGMFAFALWDDEQDALLLARDPYGIKPLYTADDGMTFRFASQVKALLAGGELSRDPDPAGLVGFHLFGHVPEPFTLYRGIRALPAGHTQWIERNRAEAPRPFANLAAMLSEGSSHPARPEELRCRVREATLDSVRAHMLADVEVGAFLSAGVDSGALLGLMRDAGQRDIRAVTLGFKEFRGTPQDEVPLARQTAERYGASHIVRYVDEQEFLCDLPDILAAMDQPSIDGVNTWFVSKAAREAGLKVAISGLGGDELLAGYPSFVDLPRWKRRFGPFAALPGMGALSRKVISTFAADLARSRPKMMDVFDYANSWQGVYFLRRGLFLPRELPQVLDPELVREGLAALEPLSLIAGALAPDPGPAVAKVCALESANYMRNQLLRDADWASMAHGLEVRVPLVDTELLGALAPAIGGMTAGEGKAALAHAPQLPLPDEVLHRAKSGFGVPTGHWMAAAAGGPAPASDSEAPAGVTSRQWSRVVLDGIETPCGAGA